LLGQELEKLRTADAPGGVDEAVDLMAGLRAAADDASSPGHATAAADLGSSYAVGTSSRDFRR
jgi:hypothetical protein